MQVPPCVLIVEDEILLAFELENAMLDMGLYVSGLAPTPDHARSLAKSDSPDIVLMDVCLEGGREGIETARWMRDMCGAGIVFVTAYTDQDTVDRIEERVPGAAVLSKPVSQKRLKEAVTAML